MDQVFTILTQRHGNAAKQSMTAAVVLAKVNSLSGDEWRATIYRKKCITILSPSPGAAQNLVLQKKELLKEINALLGEGVVEKLIIRYGVY